MTRPRGELGDSLRALSVDELEVLAAVAGTGLPPLLHQGREPERQAGETQAVVRGLLARGLLMTAASDGVATREEAAVAPGAARLLRPLLHPDAIAEVEVGGIRTLRHVVAGSSEGGVVVASEREPEIWVLEPRSGAFADLVWELLEDHVPGPAAASGVSLQLPVDAVSVAEQLARRGSWEALGALLRDYGVPGAAGAAWQDALHHRRGRGSVVLRRRVDEGVCEDRALTWLDCAEHGVWSVNDDLADDGAITWAAVENVGRQGVLSGLIDLIGR